MNKVANDSFVSLRYHHSLNILCEFSWSFCDFVCI